MRREKIRRRAPRPTKNCSRKYSAKAEHWKYEKEWRILGIRIGHSEPGVYQFPASALVAIILGCQTTPVQIEQAHDLVRHGKQKVRLNQANVSRSESGFWTSRKFAEIVRARLPTFDATGATCAEPT